jgi:phytoene dehydrogenase-like protein
VSVAPDVVVVGSGPNGLAAAVTCARLGLAVHVVEHSDSLGGAARTMELTESGFLHDVGAAIHPMAFASPFFQSLGIADSVKHVVPEVSFAHIIEGGSTILAHRDLRATIDGMRAIDGRRWRDLMAPLVHRYDALERAVLGRPLAPSVSVREAMELISPVARVMLSRMRDTSQASALLAGLMAHAAGQGATASARGVGMVLGAQAHVRGWPIPIGGSQSIVDMLLGQLRSFGGTTETNRDVRDLREFENAPVVILDTSARIFAELAGHVLPERAVRPYRRFRYGPGVAKLDASLDGPIPWNDSRLSGAGTIHLSGSAGRIIAAERAVGRGEHDRRPFMLVAQPSAFDPSRAPSGKHVLWAYAHVPAGSRANPTDLILSRLEEVASGVTDLVRVAASSSAMEMEHVSANLHGGDISAGDLSLAQVIARPTISNPWRTPLRGRYLCSASTSPGPGVHGMAGWWAAKTAVADIFGIQAPSVFTTV